MSQNENIEDNDEELQNPVPESLSKKRKKQSPEPETDSSDDEKEQIHGKLNPRVSSVVN
jgi:hypothetical protein